MGLISNQLYAYTEPTPKYGYAQYLQVFHEVGWTRFVIRDRNANIVEIRIPTAEAHVLEKALGTRYDYVGKRNDP